MTTLFFIIALCLLAIALLRIAGPDMLAAGRPIAQGLLEFKAWLKGIEDLFR